MQPRFPSINTTIESFKQSAHRLEQFEALIEQDDDVRALATELYESFGEAAWEWIMRRVPALSEKPIDLILRGGDGIAAVRQVVNAINHGVYL